MLRDHIAHRSGWKTAAFPINAFNDQNTIVMNGEWWTITHLSTFVRFIALNVFFLAVCIIHSVQWARTAKDKEKEALSPLSANQKSTFSADRIRNSTNPLICNSIKFHVKRLTNLLWIRWFVFFFSFILCVLRCSRHPDWTSIVWPRNHRLF